MADEILNWEQVLIMICEVLGEEGHHDPIFWWVREPDTKGGKKFIQQL